MSRKKPVDVLRADEAPVAEPMPPLHGRDRELSHLDGLVRGIRERGGALVVRGDPGIGKSALLAQACARARAQGVEVRSATGVQSEAQLAFAGLHQLLRPFLGGLERIPAPQRRALETAFGVVDGDGPDIFLIGLATLALIVETAEEVPLLLVVEDAQWLDRPSRDALAFVGRRLEMEPVLLLFAARDRPDDAPDEAGLPELRLAGLEEPAASALLDARAAALPETLRARILAEAAGNPLALIELPDALIASELEPLASDPLPLTARLEQTFASRLPALDHETRACLLIAALNDGGRVTEILGAAERAFGHRVELDVLSPAVAVGLGVVEAERFRFHHPLIRSAVHQAATPPERRRAHAALADSLVEDPDRRVWHRAAAATGPDEAVAADLQAAAERARRRGGGDVAVRALDEAGSLSEDRGQRSARLLAAAELAFEIGQADRTTSLLARVEPGTLPPAARGRLTLMGELVDPRPVAGTGRWRAVIESAERAAADGDTGLALDLLWQLGSRSWWGDPGAEARRALVSTVERVSSVDDDLRVVSLLGYAAPFDRGRAVDTRLRRAASEEAYGAETARLLAATAVVTGAWDLAPEFLASAIAGLRAQGRLVQLPRLLVMQAMVAAQLAESSVAVPAAEEARRLAAETKQPVWMGAAGAAAALAAAHRGDAELAEALAAEAERLVAHMGASHVLALVQIARGAAALGAGVHHEAFDHLRRLFAHDDPAHHWTMRWWALDDLVEASLRTGHRALVEPLVEELHALAGQTPAFWTHAVLNHARALVASEDTAEARFQAALDAAPGRRPFVRGRVLLSHGRWLRRQRRIELSRTPLRTAAEAFDTVGAKAWGARARQELRASGETARRRVPEAWRQLTPQELQIAQLAANGLSNREIAERLYLSHRTIGTHLYRLFPKLGVTSRVQLHAALGRAQES